ncbi:hypothetical protein SISNIDRAFT_463105 [Sistotremastrum niveocremeum HHB9708]|uniref:Protein CPL1-like domain-containing protein n=1 Tax=Sistotremastrum niveocremeum HHB9708 TaxID=1314777 RepID=A0A164YR31_9AGAM|nr:hypothetical protein SISNIDRAFT_463105 [Sistotremastrum niveocremeum HHB9708]
MHSAWIVALALFAPASASASAGTSAFVYPGRRDSSDSLYSRRGSTTEDMFTSRRSSVTDTCAFTEQDLTSRSEGETVVPSGKCLCVSDIDNFINSSPDAAQLDALSPAGDVHNAIESLVTRSPGALTCLLPSNAHFTDPCNSCATNCNAGYFDNGSGCVAHVKRAGSGMRKRADLRPLVHRCKKGTTACGVPGQFGRSECLDTSSDLENCGGCSTPVTNHNGTRSLTTADGQNCAAIPNVLSVQCASSKCQVSSCKPGYRPASDGSYCIRSGGAKLARLAGPIPLSQLGVASA